MSINSILNRIRKIISPFLGIWLASKIIKGFKETLLTMAGYYIVLLLIIELIQLIRNSLKGPTAAQ
ncbi:hypothetical protein NU09_0869 [Flavobacterium beibuense]|uniref:Uncharacterized protein n=1 Tax=Flavobacterium beibuense TaxID=657326 RepID=A0A444WEM2_9FLAO|nr:hypothetical protein NU09_0869 [Flavobacterium beibuense]